MRLWLVLLLSFRTVSGAVASDATVQNVDQLFTAFNGAGSPGCSVGVIRNGLFVYKKSFGYATLELGVPLTPQSVFYVGSVSKQFTAASGVLAAEQDYLSLDDDVRKYLPELPDYGHPVTLRQRSAKIPGNCSTHHSVGGQGWTWSTKHKVSVELPIEEHGLLQIELRYWEDLMIPSRSQKVKHACFDPVVAG